MNNFNHVRFSKYYFPICFKMLKIDHDHFSKMKIEKFFDFQVQRQDIIVQLACPPPNGTHVLLDYSLPNYMTDTFYDKTMLIRITIFFILVLLILFRNFRKMLKKNN